jgi:hypothetical protein
MSTPLPQPRPFATWTEMLDTIERSLESWLPRAVEPPPPEARPQTDSPVPLRLFEEHLARLQAYLDQAGQNAERAEMPLTTEIEALQSWLERLQAGRCKLAEK